MVAKNTVFRLFARGDCGMYRYIVPFSSLANHSRALFGVVNSTDGRGVSFFELFCMGQGQVLLLRIFSQRQ